jgi:hypothetical protein
MKYFPLFFCSVLFFAVAVSAQTNQTSNCPPIDVSGGGIAKPGEAQTFTASVENYDLSKLSFNWSVSTGEILEGQGTLSIKVLKKNDAGENITATVEIKGLPQGCAKTASETGSPFYGPYPRLFDEFSISELRIDKARLDYLVNKLGNDPNAQAFIIEYFKPKTPKRIINQKIQKITDYLVNQRKLEKDGFTISTAFRDEGNWTKVWIIPPGANLPQP